MAESQNVEWKESWRDEYIKCICGFANAQGGKIYIGTDGNGAIIGIQDSKKLLEEKILSVIRENPHITQSKIASKIECSERTVKRLMKIMIEKGMIERIGGRRLGKWVEK